MLARLLAALDVAQEATSDPDTPRLRIEPRFELEVTREPVDRTMRLLLQSLGRPDADFWISASAFVIYGESLIVAGQRAGLR